MNSLDENKSAGPIGIPTMFIKRYAKYLDEPLLKSASRWISLTAEGTYC